MCPSVGATAQEDLHCIVNHFYSTTPPPAAASAGMYNACIAGSTVMQYVEYCIIYSASYY